MVATLRKIFSTECALGLALGTGFATALRFNEIFGFSEIVIAVLLIVFFSRRSHVFFGGGWARFSWLKLYLFASVFFIMPIVTFIFGYFGDVQGSFRDVVVFCVALAFMYLIIGEVQHGLDVSLVVLSAGLSFIILAIVAMFFFPEALSTYGTERFSGGAKNPNQTAYYALSIMLLASIFLNGVTAIVMIFVVGAIGLKTKSDAFFVSLLAAAAIYFVLSYIYQRRLTAGANFFFLGFFALMAALIGFLSIGLLDSIVDAWMSADEGFSRLMLYKHALEAIAESPLIGFGAGSFSGLTGPFQGAEAHNTFLDFAMIFGLAFPVVVYAVFFSLFVSLVKMGRMFPAAMTFAYIVMSQFHFVGRHFVFWFIFSIVILHLNRKGGISSSR